MTKKLHIKSNDKVQVISGKDKGKTGKVLHAFPTEGKVLVEGINILTKHKKPSQGMPQGGIITEEGKIDASNVLLFCDACDKGVRTRKQINEDGTKVRVCTKCGKVLD